MDELWQIHVLVHFIHYRTVVWIIMIETVWLPPECTKLRVTGRHRMRIHLVVLFQLVAGVSIITNAESRHTFRIEIVIVYVLKGVCCSVASLQNEEKRVSQFINTCGVQNSTLHK